MKKFYILSMLCIISVGALAQNSFKRVYNVGGSFLKVVPYDYGNQYRFVGHSASSWTALYKLDQNGNIISNHDFQNLFPDDVGLQFLDSVTYLIYGYEPSGANSSMSILKTDTSGNIYWKHAINIYTSGDIFSNCIELPDNTVLCAGKSTFSGYRHPFVMKLDTAGNISWCKSYGNYISGSQFLHSINNNYFFGINSDSLGATIAKIDTSGNVLWCKSLIRPKGYLHSICDNADGTFTLSGAMDSVTNSNPPPGSSFKSKLFLMKMDTSGSIIWAKTYGDTTTNSFHLFTSKVISISNGENAIAATMYSNARNDYNSCIIRTDTAGNIVWVKNHGSNVSFESGYDAFQTVDNGFLIGGTTDSYSPASGYYILKTDSLGETATHCQEYTDTIAVNNFVVNDSLVLLSSSTLIINAHPSLINDTTYSPPNVYDGCILSGVPDLRESQYHKYNAYPNPNSGKFSISGVQKKYEITVYDNQGNVVLQKTEMSEIPPQLDLSKQPKGVYHIRIKEGEKISVSRVVVQ